MYNSFIMINLEEGKRFSDDVYATKEDVKAVYNLDDITSIWNKVLDYRNFYDTEISLKDSESHHYKICLTKKLLGSSYSLMLSLLKDGKRLDHLLQDNRSLFEDERRMSEIKATSNFLSISLTKGDVERLSSGEMESIPLSLYPLKAYVDAYNSAFRLHQLTLKDMENINKTLCGDTLEAEAQYRKSDIDDSCPLLAPEPNKIPSYFQDLFDFLGDETVPLILRGLSIPYFFSYVRPFELGNEMTAALTAKVFLKVNGLDELGFYLDLESVCYTKTSSFFKYLKTSEKSLDLTYYLNAVLLYFRNQEREMCERILFFKSKDEEDRKRFRSQIKPLPVSPAIGKDMPLTYANQYALPEFPQEEKKDVQDTAEKLIHVYPKLKRKEAHFYAGHCTIGLHYTIEDFKTTEHTVYETARTSLERLVILGFYRKDKTGKKFTYTPIPMKKEEADKQTAEVTKEGDKE